MTTRFASLFAVGAVALIAFSVQGFAQGAPRIGGKPNFTGFWGLAPAPPAPTPAANGRTRTKFQGGDAPKALTRREVGLKDIPLAPWGREAFLYYTAGDGPWQGETGSAIDPRYHDGACGGPKSPADIGNNFHITQTPEMLMLVAMSDQPWIRKVWIGSKHPADLTEYVPFWMGHSVGRWEGDTLVVDTVRIKEGTVIESPRVPKAVNSTATIPQSGNLRMTERFTLGADGNLQIERTFEDPVAFTGPWSDRKTLSRRTNFDDMKLDWEVGESHAVCDPKGGYWREYDPWFDNFDKLKKEILPDQGRLDKGLPPVPEKFRQQQQ